METKKKRVTYADCIVCGKEFEQYRASQKFCGMSCRNKYHYRQRAEAFKAFKEAQKK